MTASDPPPASLRHALRAAARAAAGRARRTDGNAEPPDAAGGARGDGDEDGSSPVDWAFTRVWARRELYTLRLPQARFDLSQDPAAAGGRIYRTVPVVGPEIVPRYAEGAFVLGPTTGPTPAETHVRLFALQPFATVEADLSVTGSVHGAAMIEWMSGDGTSRLVVAAERHSGTISAELSVHGTPVASLPGTPADLSGEFTLVAQLQGRSVLVWHRRGRAMTYVGRLDFGSHLDLRQSATARGWTLGLTARGHTDLEVRCTRFEANLTGNGHADPRIVSHEDGTPVQDGSTVWFLATTRGGTIPDAFQGVYALDVPTGRITMTGALFGHRDGDGTWRNDNAGHLVHDRRTGTWTWFAIGHSDHPGPRRNYVGTSDLDLRYGVSHLPVEEVAMPAGGALWEDVHPVRDGARWIATASKNARHTAWLESAGGLAGPWTEIREAVGMDETGQVLVRSGSRRYVVAGTATAAYVVRDADDPAMTALGHLDVDADTGGARVWPALFPLRQPDGVRWYLLSFDRTSPAERYSYGRLHFYRQA